MMGWGGSVLDRKAIGSYYSGDVWGGGWLRERADFNFGNVARCNVSV